MKTKTAKPLTYSEEIAKLSRSFNRLLSRLDREARADACKGDIVTGWDWPTLAAVRPVEFAQLQAWKSRAVECKRALRSAGLLAA